MDLSKASVEKALRNTWDSVRARVEKGSTAIRDQIGRLPYVASITAAEQHDEIARDESHYFLIPTPFAESGYAIYSTRRLPPGVATANDLPRLRVFHLPGPGSESTLTDLVVADKSSGPTESTEDPTTTLADRLKLVANEIDRHERTVTGGILLIGGAVAIANPLLGIGIAAKAILPSIGAVVSRHGLKLAGDKLKGWSDRRQEKQQERERAQAEQAARGEFDSVPVTSFVNPLLRDLEHALRTTGSAFDPGLDVDFDTIEVEGWNRRELIQLTVQAITNTYGAATGDCVAPEFNFGPEDRRWLETLRILARTEDS